MSGHTPGPWRSGIGSRHRKRIDVRGGDLYPGAAAPPIVASIPREHDRDTCHANARLIAAAPEMLAALVALVGNAGEEGGGELRQLEADGTVDALDAQGYLLRECIAAARAAIAKAVQS